MRLSSTFVVALSALPFMAYAANEEVTKKCVTMVHGEGIGFVLTLPRWKGDRIDKLKVSLKKKCGVDETKWKFLPDDDLSKLPKDFVGWLSKTSDGTPYGECLGNAIAEANVLSRDDKKVECTNVVMGSGEEKLITETIKF